MNAGVSSADVQSFRAHMAALNVRGAGSPASQQAAPKPVQSMIAEFRKHFHAPQECTVHDCDGNPIRVRVVQPTVAQLVELISSPQLGRISEGFKTEDLIQYAPALVRIMRFPDGAPENPEQFIMDLGLGDAALVAETVLAVMDIPGIMDSLGLTTRPKGVATEHEIPVNN